MKIKGIPGKTRRERIAASVAIAAGCAGSLWAVSFTELSYGHETAGDRSHVFTNGFVSSSTALAVFAGCFALSAFCALLFWVFRFLDRGHNDVA
jgi:hypothetical protein